MQIRLVILFLILIQLVLLLVWMHSTQLSLIHRMSSGDRLSEEQDLLNRTQTANPTQPKPDDEDVQKVLPSCPEDSPLLLGPLRVEFNWSRTMESVRTDFNSTLLEGGRYRPPDCVSHHKVAIIIPFRNRRQHLIQWLYYLHPILQRQQLDYGVYVINQDGEGTFNRAKLMNVGFAEAMKDNYTCFVFSDVDLIPIDDRNIYGCFIKPRHLSVAVDKFNFMLPYPNIFGGVVSFSKEQFMTINGFPNNFWGWGGEDDNVFQRTAIKFSSISRPDMQTGRFKMIKHNGDLHNEPNPQNPGKLSRTAFTMDRNGFNSLTYTSSQVAIIIPFRNRHRHLIQWLHHVHPILQRQQLDYGVYVINQDGEGTFNRAKLMNVGFVQALKAYNYTCFVFSDVDLLPIDDRNIYGCFGKPRHLSVAVDKFNFRLPYATIFGGVVSFSKEQYMTINGFPNDFWGWGGEDDDVFQRMTIKSMTISRPDMQTGRFTMIKHERDQHNDPNPQRFDKLSKTQWTMQEDGINSLEYTINKVEKDKLCTFITVDIGRPN